MIQLFDHINAPVPARDRANNRLLRSQPEAACTTSRKVAPDFFSPQVAVQRRFYLDLKASAGQPLTVISAGYEQCRPDYAIRRATFPFFAIEFVSRGRGRITLNNCEYELQPGSLFAYGPGIQHTIHTDPALPLQKYFVDFSGPGAKRLLRDAKLSNWRVLHGFQLNEVQSIFDEMIRSGAKQTLVTPELCTTLLKCLALRISESCAPGEGPGTLSLATFQRCQRYIQENFLKIKTVEQVAHECHIHEVYLCRIFQRYHHQTPHRYITHLKMNWAADLLRRPGAMVKQVAEAVGFEDQFHFSRAFKKEFGVSPDGFRQLR